MCRSLACQTKLDMHKKTILLSQLNLHELSNHIAEVVSKQISHQLSQPKESLEDEFLTVHQASKLLSLATQTIYQKVNKAELPYYKKGGRIYFIKSELTGYLKEGRQKTSTELREEASDFLIARKRGES